jgi:hypothetical protein
MNDLSTLDSKEMEELAAILGTEVSGGASTVVRVPELRINAKSVNKDTKKPIPQGSFYLKGSDKIAYAESVTFRPLASHVQYFNWDDIDGKRTLVNKSIAVLNPYKDEARDMLGSIACGMPSWDDRQHMDKEVQKKWRAMQHRLVRGVVSFIGTTEDGEEVVYENEPCMMFHKNSTYSGFYNGFVKKIPKGHHLYNYEAKLTSEYNENGSVVWYTFQYEPDLSNILTFNKEVRDTSIVFAESIRAENKYIDSQYMKAITEGSIDGAAMTAIDSLDADFEDVA